MRLHNIICVSVCLCVCAGGLSYHKCSEFLGVLEDACHAVSLGILKDKEDHRALLLWACNVRTMLHSNALHTVTGAFHLHCEIIEHRCIYTGAFQFKSG